MCDKCSENFATDSDTVKYKCGHIFHRGCLLPQKMSILNPRCKKCENGMIDGYPDEEEEEEEEEEEKEEEEEEDEEKFTKCETIVLIEITILAISLIGLLIGML